MSTADLIRQRLLNQRLSQSEFTDPSEIVHWLGAMQAQEYAMAKWAIGLRIPGIKDEDVETAFNGGRILRTHLLRPTWHFVSPDDIRWVLQLTGPRVKLANAFTFRECELNSKIVMRSNDALARALQGGRHRTRDELSNALSKIKISANGVRLACLLMWAEQDGVICSGPRHGKQFTYALLDERSPVAAGKNFDRDEALGELTLRYFSSRGPATIKDFAKWSGLTIKDAKAGVAMFPSRLAREVIDEKEYFFVPEKSNDTPSHKKSFLMPDYDEYGIGYSDRSAIFSKLPMTRTIREGNPVFNQLIIIDGRIAGTWKRTLKNDLVILEAFPLSSLSEPKQRIVRAAASQYASFIGKTLELKLVSPKS